MIRLLPALALVLAAGCAAPATPERAPLAVAARDGGAVSAEASRHVGDYLPAHAFKLEIDGVIVGGFKEAYGDGTDDLAARRPGKAKYKNIVLKRGFWADSTLAAWLDGASKDAAKRKSGSIIYLDREGNEVLRTAFFEAWPVRFEGKAVGDDLMAFTSLVVAVESGHDVSAADADALKTRHETAKNSVGNVR